MLTTFYFSLSLCFLKKSYNKRGKMRRRWKLLFFLKIAQNFIKFPPSLDTKSLSFIKFPQRNENIINQLLCQHTIHKLRTHDSYFFEKQNGLRSFVATFCSRNYRSNFCDTWHFTGQFQVGLSKIFMKLY